MIESINVRSGVRAALQTALRTIYPPHCLSCNEIVGTEGGLCGACWRDLHVISGLVCECCGAPLPGEDEEPGIDPLYGVNQIKSAGLMCDDCLVIPRPWSRGRAALIYSGTARRMVLGFKRGDRTDLARVAAHWMARAGRDLLVHGALLVPVPLHWRRLLQRKYNQSALLTQALARVSGGENCPDLLRRTRSTGTQEGRGRTQRFENVAGAIDVSPRWLDTLQGRHVVLVDDVFTTGATLAACAEASLDAGAQGVDVLVLARVVKDG